MAAINQFRHDNLSTQALSQKTLEEVTRLAITFFPQAILSNKLLQELRALAKGAGLDIPLVDEVAADIFMGVFSDKFLKATIQASKILKGTRYETYYGIDYKTARRLPKVEKMKKLGFRRTTSDPFVQLCSLRDGVTYQGWDPVINGMIIEQQQIYTSQNLAVLFDALDLKRTLADQLEELARNCFVWLCWRLQLKTDHWYARLIMVKNTAYAWRQMIFFLALLLSDDVQAFLIWANTHLNMQKVAFQRRFWPALKGLMLAANGRSLGDESLNELEVRRFLGWSKKRHWLLD